LTTRSTAAAMAQRSFCFPPDQIETFLKDVAWLQRINGWKIIGLAC
jgi:hypothetical protein